AKRKLRELEAEVPQADPAAIARMKYEEENRTKNSTLHNLTGFLRSTPDTSMAAKAGTQAMNPPNQLIPATVPRTDGAAAGGLNGAVTVAPDAATSPAAASPATD